MHKVMNEDISSANIDGFLTEDITEEGLSKDQKFLIDKQKDVENYNANLLNFNPIFKTKRFVEGHLIVRLVKEDFAILTDVLGIKNYVRAYDKIKKGTGRVGKDGKTEEFISFENQLPYKPFGVIAAFDPALLEKNPWLKEGIKVELTEIDNLVPYMYYVDKNNMDLGFSEEDLKAGNNVFPKFEGYFKIRCNMVEAVSE